MQPIVDKLKGDTGRLAATYLVIIMGLTIVFSVVIFAISSSQFDRPLSPRAFGGGYSQFDVSVRDSLEQIFHERAQRARAELLFSLIFLNIVVLTGGAVLSYLLARKTLEPIEAAMEAQAQFVSDASHELRTPLTALQVTNEVALRKKKLTLAQAKDLIGHNLAETIKLRALSESLLGLARQDSVATIREDTDISQLVNAIIEPFAVIAQEKNMKIKTDVTSNVVSMNPLAISQILRIFLDNALKYAPERSSITVSSATTNGELQLAVHDDGPGIAVKHQSAIFKRFYRIDESRSSRNTEGSGLGLSIAKAAADRQGYKLSLKSGEHEGNAFIVHIPL